MSRHRKSFSDLVRVVAEPSAASVAELGDDRIDELVDLAIDHRVPASLRLALADAGRPVPDALVAKGASTTAAHLQTVRALARVRDALEAAAVRWAVVKGPAIARRWPGHPSAREYDDLDLLVDPRRLRVAVDALVAIGYGHRNSNWSGFRRLGVGELPLDDGTTVIDLHWHLIGLERVRRQFRLDTARMLDRTVRIELGGVEVPTLDDADTLVHLCCHDALAGAHSLVQLRDVHLVAAMVPVGVGSTRLREARASRLASAVLDRAERVFGPIGATAIASQMCGTPGWIRANRAVDAVWTATGSRSWSPFPGGLMQSGRSSPAGTARALVSQLDESLRARTGRPTVVSEGGPLDWKVDDGGAVGLDRYLDEVEEGRFGS